MENFRESNNRENHSSIWKENIWSFQTLNLCRPWFKFKSNHWRIDLSKFELHRAQVQPSWSSSGAPCFSSSSWCSSNLGSSDENTQLQMTLKNWSKFPVNVTLKTSKLCRKVSVLVVHIFKFQMLNFNTDILYIYLFVSWPLSFLGKSFPFNIKLVK